jgi:hypothetical protein
VKKFSTVVMVCAKSAHCAGAIHTPALPLRENVDPHPKVRPALSRIVRTYWTLLVSAPKREGMLAQPPSCAGA